MILYSHFNLLRQPVIEFENFDGKLFQLICRLNITSPFKALRVDIKPKIMPTKIIVELLPEKEQVNDDVIGLFYTQDSYSYRCLDLNNYKMIEVLSKVRQDPYYNPKLGFYKIGSNIEKFYIDFRNNRVSRLWQLDKDGWFVHDRVRNIRTYCI